MSARRLAMPLCAFPCAFPCALPCALALLIGGAACVTPGEHAAEAPALAGAAPPADPPRADPSETAHSVTRDVTRDTTRMVQVRDAWLRVREEGAGDGLPVVFVHGYGSRLEGWRVVQPAIAAGGRRTVSFDQRGFGMSERPAGAYGPEAHAADLLALLDALHVERALFVGHSYGAGVVLRAALRAPGRVAGIVLVSPFALARQIPTSFRWARVPAVGEALFSSSFRDFPGEKYVLAFHEPERFISVEALDEVRANMARPGSTWAALATVRGMDYEDVELLYPRIEAPITVVWGESDRVTPIRLLPTFAERLPRAQFVRVPACGHMPSWERPAAVIDAVQALADVVTGAGE